MELRIDMFSYYCSFEYSLQNSRKSLTDVFEKSEA